MLSMQTIAVARRDGAIAMHPAAPDDEWAVRSLFGALHAHNAALEPRFALADGWQTLLGEKLARERRSGNGLTLLAWSGTEPVGLAMVAANPGEPMFRHPGWAELTALYVAPSLRGAGVADDLMAAALAWAKGKGSAELRLYVTASNSRARRFYAGAGLRPLQEVWVLEEGAQS